MKKNQHWTILGPGAIGSLWACHWLLAGQRPQLVGRKPRHGQYLQLRHHLLPDSTEPHSHELQPDYIRIEDIDSPIEHLLVCTKAQHTAAAMADIAEKLSPKAIIVVLQNGMAACELSLPEGQQLLAATTTDGAYIIEPTRQQPRQLIHAGRGRTLFGPLRVDADFDADGLYSCLPVGLDIEYCDDIHQQLWRKLAINCVLNGLTVKYQCRNGELLSNSAALAELRQLSQEVARVADALQLGPWFGQLSTHAEAVASSTANNINSMLQDVRRAQSTEIEQINGYLCRQAEQLAIDCPANKALLTTVQALSL